MACVAPGARTQPASPSSSSVGISALRAVSTYCNSDCGSLFFYGGGWLITFQRCDAGASAPLGEATLFDAIRRASRPRNVPAPVFPGAARSAAQAQLDCYV